MILIKKGRVIDPKTNLDKILDVLIDKNIVVKIEEDINSDGVEIIIDARGMVVSPGLIDVHVHFRDPGFTYKEDIITGSNSAACGGFTTVVCMANTKPVVDNEETLTYILNQCKKSKINVLQTASITKGFEGKELVDMEHLKSKGAVGFSDDGLPIMDSKLVMDAMDKARILGVPLSFHEEDPNFIGKAGINEGEVSKKLGIIGASHLAEDIMVARDCILAIESKSKINIQHISSGTSVDLIKFAKIHGANITAEVSPHHFSLTEETINTHGSNAKMNPPLRSEENRLKLIEGLKDGTIEIIATDHAPHSIEEKGIDLANSLSGIIGLETSLALGITNLVRVGHLSMIKLIEKMTINPAKLYNLSSGEIKENKVADIVVFDPNEKWVVKDFRSKSCNSPFIGYELYGKVKYTICNGKIVYKD